MLIPRRNSMAWQMIFKLIALLAICGLWGLPAYAQKKNKNNAPVPAEQKKRAAFDIRKIVWPAPPEITRVKFENILTGQQIDWAGLESKKKPKQSWMDRLAGAQPDQQIKDVESKVGFQLIRPYGVAADSKGNVYVADQAVGAIFIFSKDNSGKPDLIKHGKDARLPMINGLAMDDNDRLFVTDAKLHHVLVFNAKHEQEAVFGTEELVSPAGIALDTTNRFVYVVDTQQDQVVVFDADNYKLLRRIGTSGKKHTLTGPGEFSLPTNVAVDKEGNVAVTDTLNNRIELFDADGKFVSEFGKAGDGPGRFARPKGIAFDGDDHIWVADEYQSRIQVYNQQGQLLLYLGEQGWYPGQFQGLYGIGFDKARNRMITSEQFPGRVQVFRYVTDAEAAAEKARRDTEHTGSHTKSSDSTPQKGGGTAKEQSSVVAAR
jgi:DNA-binding beta-propeller fold protein YncE